MRYVDVDCVCRCVFRVKVVDEGEGVKMIVCPRCKRSARTKKGSVKPVKLGENAPRFYGSSVSTT